MFLLNVTVVAVASNKVEQSEKFPHDSWVRSEEKPWSQDWPIAAGAYPGFCSMKQEVFLLPLDGVLVHRRSLPGNLSGFLNNLPVPIYTPGWREAL